MLRSMKTKKGAWVKAGHRGPSSSWPGSFGDYTYIRAPPKPYPKTAQQKAIASKGYCVQEKCKGKKDSDFLECRRSCTG